jgi:hypothetical protein
LPAPRSSPGRSASSDPTTRRCRGKSARRKRRGRPAARRVVGARCCSGRRAKRLDEDADTPAAATWWRSGHIGVGCVAGLAWYVRAGPGTRGTHWLQPWVWGLVMNAAFAGQCSSWGPPNFLDKPLPATKPTGPLPCGWLVIWPRQFDLLTAAAPGPLTLLAPAGAGKATLFGSWVTKLGAGGRRDGIDRARRLELR